jgi:gliding motility-associated-like protein
MLKRLNYILLMILLLAIQWVAQAQYVIDKVCKDAVRTYRVDKGDGDPILSYTWILKDHLGNPVSIPAGSGFADTDAMGNSIEGSEIVIKWSFAPGIYTLSVEKQSLSKCSVAELGTVEVAPLPVFVVKNPSAVCEGQTVNLNASAITAGSDPGLLLTYWNDESATSPLTNYTAITSGGTYYIKADNGAECPVVLPVTVTFNPKRTPQFSLLSSICFNSPALTLPTTSIDLVTGTWNPSVVSTSVLGEKTTYVFTPAPGECALPTHIEITVVDNIVPTFAAIGPFCVGETPTPLPLTSVNNITGAWSSPISTAIAGTFDYTFTPDPGQCAAPFPMSITVTDPVTPTFDPIGSICQNSLTNPLQATSIEGITGTWAPAFSSATVGPQTYTFTPDPGQCAKQASVTITVTPSVSVTFDPIGPFCAGDPVPLLPPTSNEGVSGTWSPAVVDMTQTRTYTFTASTVCTNPFYMTVKINRLNITATKVDLGYSTNPIGSIALAVSGGSDMYSYSWSGPSGFKSSLQNLTGLAAGDYTVVVKDLTTKCEEPLTVTLTQSILTVSFTSTPNSCFGGNNGSATAIPSGGVPPYTYLWDNGKKTPTISGLIAGTYNVTVTDANGLVKSSPIVISQPPELIVTATQVNAPDCSETALVLVAATGGTPGYNGVGTFPATAGLHTFTVTDANGCPASVTIDVILYNRPQAPFVKNTIQPTCFASTGTIEVGSQEPATGISYSVTGPSPVNVTTKNSTGVFSGLVPGVYEVSVVNSYGCSSDPITVTVDVPPVIPTSPTAIPVPPECEAIPAQTLDANWGILPPPPGTTIVWYDAPTGGKAIANPIRNTAGSVTYYAEATNGECASKRTPVTLTIIPRPAAPISKGNLSACESTPLVTLDARDAIDATGKNLVWYDNLVGGNVVASPTLNAVQTVTYYAEDISGVCASSSRTPVTLTIYPLPAKPAAVVSVAPRCIDTSGIIEVKAPIGPNFVYNIDNGPYQSSVMFNNQASGSHPVRVKNILTNCESDTTIITVPNIPPAPHIMKLATKDCACFGGLGELNFEFANVADGTYVIVYVGGQFNNVKVVNGKASILAPAGTYNVLAIQANGCTSRENWNVEIKQPDQISISAKITEINLKSGQKGEIDLTISGGTGNYTTIWQPNTIIGFPGANTQDINDLSNGDYIVHVIDEKNCQQTDTITIPLPNQPPIATDDYFVANCNIFTGDLLNTDNGNGVDSDPDGDPIVIDKMPVKTPSHGTLTINSDGTFEYTAMPGYTGDDVFRYVIYDIKKNYSTPATVTIHIVSDTDRDGIADDLDPDADGDGILNVDEVMAGQDRKTTDSDGDGRPNYLDIDSDNDGVVDNIEAQSTPGYIKPSGIDKDHNGIDDAYDPAQGGTRINPVDTDSDKVPDFLDVDSDGDGVADYIEGNDSNSDGKPDYVLVGKDSDVDGLDDGFDDVVNVCSPTENVVGSNAAMQDFDGDGLKDWRDENDDDDEYLTRFEDLNMDGNFSNDDTDLDGHPEYLDYGRDCDLFIPNAFSPNDDNIHDYFQIYCIDHFPNAKMYIFDQLGNLLYQQSNYGNLEVWKTPENAWWDGRTKNKAATTSNGGKVVPGTYYYVLNLGNGEVKKSFVFVSY